MSAFFDPFAALAEADRARPRYLTLPEGEDYPIGTRVEGEWEFYGHAKWKCALCQTVRWLTDLSKMPYRDESFSLCNGKDDAKPTCFEKYADGRALAKSRAVTEEKPEQ